MSNIVGPAHAGSLRAAGSQAQPQAYQAFRILQLGFVVAPIAAGADKFFNLLVNWEQYLAPVAARIIDPRSFMMAVGVIEVIAGLLVAVKPRIGGYVVSAWLLGIVVNLLLIPGYFDVALRDFGLALGALAMARLAEQYSD